MEVGDYTSQTPLQRFVDATPPESDKGHIFTRMANDLVTDPAREIHRKTIKAWLRAWRDQYEPLSEQLSQLAHLGLWAVAVLESGEKATTDDQQQRLTVLERAVAPEAELLIMIIPGVQRLVEVAYGVV